MWRRYVWREKQEQELDIERDRERIYIAIWGFQDNESFYDMKLSIAKHNDFKYVNKI